MPLNWSQETYIQAYRFAAHAHRGQMYPGTDLPYILHLGFVSMEIMAVLSVEPGHDGDFALQCALLHDVIEDTDISFEQVRTTFGLDVANGVLALSKDPTLEKSHQLGDSLTRIRQQPIEVWMVKLADRIANLQLPPAYWTPDKVARYREQAIEIHAQLQTASPFLASRLAEKIAAYPSGAQPTVR